MWDISMLAFVVYSLDNHRGTEDVSASHAVISGEGMYWNEDQYSYI